MFVTIRPEDFDASSAPMAAVLALCGSPIADVRDHLGAEHVALLGLGLDVGLLPAPDSLRATRDVGPVQRALNDLQTLELVTAHPKGLVLDDAAASALTEGLRAYWAGELDGAMEHLHAAPEGAATTALPCLTWLRRLLIFATHRGLRRTDTGALHQGDIRRYEATCEFPARGVLDQTATFGASLEVFLDLGGKLIVGPGVDLVDLPADAFVRECDHAWVDGRVALGLEDVTSAAGLLGYWEAPLAAQAAAEGAQGVSVYGANMRASQAVDNLLGSVAPDPATSVLAATKSFDLRGTPAAVAAFHDRAREIVASTIQGLPNLRALPVASVARLLAAQLALLSLDQPVQVPRRAAAPPAHVFSAGLTPLPWFSARAREATPRLARLLRGLHGSASLQDDTLTLTAPAHAATHAGKLMVQPNGDVLAPPDASIHALVHLACGARPTRLDTMSTFAIDRRALMRLADAGMDVAEWGELLAQWTGGPLPPTVRELVAEIARRHGELTLSPAGAVLVAQDPVRLAELLSYPKLARAVLLKASDTVVILRSEVDVAALLEDLGDRGFSAIVTDEP